MPRTIAIGDIHGCCRAFRQLLELIEPQPEDTLVILGDFIDRGPDTKGVIEILLELQGRCHVIALLGNHESMFLDVLTGRLSLFAWGSVGGVQMLDSYGDGLDFEDVPRAHIQFIESCRLYHETDRHIFVHAGVYPNFRIEEQPSKALLWDALRPGAAAPHYSGKTVICGHTEQERCEVLDLGFVKCIDTACCTGGCLTALDVLTGTIWQTRQDGAGPRQADARTRW